MLRDDFITKKEWQDLTIADNFIFGKVLESDPDTCKLLLETILGFEIDYIKYPEREKTIETRRDSKGVRLDVFVKTADGQRVFDVEIQTSNNDDLAKRMRYYQSMLDTELLDKGKDYWELSATYIIFVCTFDYFKKGRHIYTFRERCDQDSDLLLNDGTVKIFLNPKSKMNDVSENLLAFLNYIAGIKSDNLLVEALDNTVQNVKKSREWRNDRMRWEEEIRAQAHWAAVAAAEEAAKEARAKALEEGRAEGRSEGKAEGKAEGKFEMIRNFLKAGASMELITKATGWTEDQIRELSAN